MNNNNNDRIEAVTSTWTTTTTTTATAKTHKSFDIPFKSISKVQFSHWRILERWPSFTSLFGIPSAVAECRMDGRWWCLIVPSVTLKHPLSFSGNFICFMESKMIIFKAYSLKRKRIVSEISTVYVWLFYQWCHKTIQSYLVASNAL